MKLKKEILILAAVIIGLSIYLVVRKQDRALYELPKLPAVSGNEITRIEIVGPQPNLELNREGEHWTVGSQKYPAAKSKVQQMIDTIETLTLTELISTSGDAVRYDLTDEKKISVKAWAGDSLAREFEIGKAAPSFRHTFVRITGDSNIYNARDNFRSKFDQTLEDIRDKQVMSFSVSDIRQIELSRGADSLLLERKERSQQQSSDPPTDQEATAPVKAEMIWQTAEGAEADQAKLDSLLTTLSQLNCESFVADRGKSDFSKPIIRIRAVGLEEYELVIFDKLNEADDKHPAISSQNAYPFYLPQWKVNNLMPESAELMKSTESN